MDQRSPSKPSFVFVEWFGEKIAVQVIANEGKFPLLGTGLLEGRILSIDYVAKELRLD